MRLHEHQPLTTMRTWTVAAVVAAAGVLFAALFAGDSGAAHADGAKAAATRTVYVTRIVHAIPVYKIRGPRDSMRVVRKHFAALDFAAQEQARALVVAVEACWSEAIDFTLCDSALDLAAYPVKGLVYGNQGGQAEVTMATAAEYGVTGHSRSGNAFNIQRDADGKLSHTCYTAHTHLCRIGGTW